MKDKELRLNNKFMITECLFCLIIVFMTLIKQHQIVSVVFATSFVILVAFFVYKTYKKLEMDHQYKAIFRILLVSFICVLINSFGQRGTLRLENFKNYTMFCSTIIFMFLMLNIRTDNKIGKAILVINIFIAALYPVTYYIIPGTVVKYMAGGLTFNYSNPNLTGMWMLQSVLYMSVAIVTFKSKTLKLFLLAILGFDIYFMFETAARNAMIAFALFVVGSLWIFMKSRFKFSKKLIALVNVIPIAFVFIYLKYIDVVSKSGRLSFLVSEGKNLSSRVRIWENVFTELEGKWLLGNYYILSSNMHNSHLVLLGGYGIITLVMVVYFMYKMCCIVNENSKSKKNLCCLVAFFAVIFMGIGEGALFSGSMGLYILACGFIYLARCNFDESVPEIEEVL